MHAPYVLRIRTVSNSDGLYGTYDPSTALSIRTLTIRTDRTDRNTLCSDVIMRCTLRMCSDYGPLAKLTVCTERTIRQLPITVRNSVTVLGMTGKLYLITYSQADVGRFPPRQSSVEAVLYSFYDTPDKIMHWSCCMEEHPESIIIIIIISFIYPRILV